MLSTVIYLKEHVPAVQHLPVLLRSAIQHEWHLNVFDAVNGANLPWKFRVDQRYPKVIKTMERPGVRGCFASHYELWTKALTTGQTMAIFEHDILFVKPPPTDLGKADIIKLDGFRVSKPAPTGQWWEGAHAYIIKPQGAKKLIEWVGRWGASPADFMLGDKVADIAFDLAQRVQLVDLGSTTWNLPMSDELT